MKRLLLNQFLYAAGIPVLWLLACYVLGYRTFGKFMYEIGYSIEQESEVGNG